MTEAAVWFRNAAEKGSAGGMYVLGLMMKDGDGVKKDKIESVKLIRRSAEMGCIDAMECLARMYDAGDCVETNKEESFRWHQKALERGTKGVKPKRGTESDNVIKEMGK